MTTGGISPSNNASDQDVYRSVVVTGSSRGIGRAIALELAKRGHAVCVNYTSASSAEEAQKVADNIKHVYNVDSFAFQADVSKSEQAQMLIDAVKEQFGSVDILVNNAGINRDGLIARMKEEDFDRVIEVNLKGVFNCCKSATSYMMKQRYGRIINMSSIVGIAGNAGQSNYAASKAGIIGLSKSLARELASRNITVNVVAPGYIETDMTRALSEKQQSAICDRIASKRLGSPEDVAFLVGFLTDEKAGYITGQVVGVDGGMSL